MVGAGIVGVCCGHALLRRGFDVTLVDPDEPGHGASFGNAGSIGLASVPPLGTPGMVRQLPRMLLDPMHPLVVRARHLPTSLPWLLRFRRTLAPGRVEAISRARAALLGHAGVAWEALLAEIGRPELIRGGGLVVVYESRAAFEAARPGIALRRRHGVVAHELDGDAVRELEPAISDRVVCGVHHPAVRTTTDPLALTRAVVDAYRARGGRVLRARVRAFERGAGGVERIVTDSGPYACDLVVLAAGAWSRALARGLGERFPLIAERGYHVMIADPASRPSVPVLSGDRNVSIVAMTHGLRMTTMSELAAIDAPADHARALRIFRGAAGVIRGLEVDVASSWVGARPSTPDSLPVIGRSTRHCNVIHAFGHGHLGLTFGAITGSLVATLASGEAPNLDMSPYHPDRRFDGSHLDGQPAAGGRL